MSWLQSGTPSTSVPAVTVLTVTVPVGVVPGNTCVIHSTGTAPSPPTCVISSPGRTFTDIVPFTTFNNMWSMIAKTTGLSAGDVVTVTVGAGKPMILGHHYFDADLGTPGTVGSRGGVSSVNMVAPAITVPAGKKVFVIAGERVATVGTVNSSVTNSNGDVVTTDQYFWDSAVPNCSVYLGEFIEPTTNTGSTTVTSNNASGNGIAFHIPDTLSKITDSRSTTWNVGTALLTRTASRSTTWKVVGNLIGSRQTFWATKANASYLLSGDPVNVTDIDTTITVPAGVTAGMYALINVAGSSSTGDGGVSTSITVTKVGGGGTFTDVLPSTMFTNAWAGIIKATGLVAGDVINVTLGSNHVFSVAHHYFNTDFGVVGDPGTRGGITKAQVTAPTIDVSAGQKIFIISIERSSTVDTTVTSMVNSNGVGVTADYFVESPTTSYITFLLAEYVATSTDSGSTTMTYSNTSLNALAFQLASGTPQLSDKRVITWNTQGLVKLTDSRTTMWNVAVLQKVTGSRSIVWNVVGVAAPTSGLIMSSSVSWFGPDFLRGGWIVNTGTNVRMVVSRSAAMTSPVYSGSVAVPTSKRVTAKVTGLSSDTHYYVGLEIDGRLQTDLRVAATTLPTVGAQKSFNIVAGSCQHTGSNHRSLARASMENASYMVHMGDLHYADASTVTAWSNAVLSSLSQQNMKRLTTAMPMQWTWDNHDGAGGNEGNKASPAWSGVQAGYRELTGDLPDASAAYRTWVHARVRCIRTDMWSQRDPYTDAESSAKSFLGATQKQWWKDTLTASDPEAEPIILWFSGWTGAKIAGGRWNSYTTELAELQDWLDARPDIKSRMIMIGGDSHFPEADSGTRPGIWSVFPGMPSLNASPFDQQGTPFETQAWDIGVFDIPDDRGAYSRIEVTDTGSNINFKWSAIYDDGSTIFTWNKNFAATPTQSIFEYSGGVETPLSIAEWDGTTEQALTISVAP